MKYLMFKVLFHELRRIGSMLEALLYQSYGDHAASVSSYEVAKKHIGSSNERLDELVAAKKNG
jgi:hypothetical protein